MQLELEDEDALRHLVDDIDGLVDVALAGDELLIGKYLNSDADLRAMLSSQDKELRTLQEKFIEEHCEQAENLCVLYNELSECEGKLHAFEEQIFTFQKTLTDTAEDIVKMQQQTVDLVHRVANRKHVSNKINEVYNALKECEEFCEAITSKEVDREYLGNIQKLESKIAFLANNKDLENSSVDQEIRPKLRIAAQRAGDKLHRYLAKKIVALAEEGTNIALQQQALENAGQYAYSFLDRYNRPVAADLQQTYLQTMSDVYGRLARHLVRDVAEFLPYASGSAGGVVSQEVLKAVRAGKDCGTPGGSFLLPPPPIAPAGAVKERRQTSVTLRVEERVRGFADIVRGKSESRLRPTASRAADLHDLVDSVCAIDFSYSVITLDPTFAIALDTSNCWVWRLAKLFTSLVNMVAGESRFITNFFFAHGQDLEQEELLSRQVLAKALDMILEELRQDVPQVKDRLSCIAGLRVVDRMKTFLCQNQNPIPLLLLSTALEVVTNCLRRTLYDILAADYALLSQLAAQPLPVFPSKDAALPLQQELAQNSQLAACLGPHDVTRQFALSAGAVHLFNTMKLSCSRVDSASVYDDGVHQQLRAQQTAVVSAINVLAQRHARTVLQNIFRIQNLAHLLLTWKAMAVRFSKTHVVAPSTPQDASDEVSLADGPQVVPAQLAHDIEVLMRNEIVRFIGEDSKQFGIHGLLTMVQEAEAVLGAVFFSSRITTSSSGEAVDTPVALASLPEVLQETAVLSTLASFSKTWKDDIRTIAASVRATFSLAPGMQRARSVTPDAAGIEESTSGEFLRAVAGFVLREYFHTLLDANRHIHAFVNAYYGKHSTIQAKLVGNLALLHEVESHIE